MYGMKDNIEKSLFLQQFIFLRSRRHLLVHPNLTDPTWPQVIQPPTAIPGEVNHFASRPHDSKARARPSARLYEDSVRV